MLCEEPPLSVQDSISRFNQATSQAPMRRMVKFNTVNNGSSCIRFNTTVPRCNTLASNKVELCKACKPLIANSYGHQMQGAGQDRLGIYIKSVVKGGAADADGRLQAGDQLLKVDGQSLVGITQEKAAEYLVRTGPIVTLEVAKQGAIYHGLATLLSQPSPVMARAPSTQYPMVMDKPGLPKSVSLSSFRERTFAPPPFEYDFQGEPPYYCGPPPRPGSPTVLRISVPIITTTPPPPDNPVTPITPNNYLSVPIHNSNCYKLPKKKMELSEDIFQEHQARLINCDSEDASAFLHRPSHDPEKVDVVRCFTNRDCPAPDWLNLSLERANRPPPPGRWYPLTHAKPWKSDIYLTKSGEWKLGSDTIEENSLDSKEPIQRSKSAEDLLEHNFESSSSECECNNNSLSPKSTDSSDLPPKVDATEMAATDTTNTIHNLKLTKEERLKALKELDEIVNGMEKITEFANKKFSMSINVDNKSTFPSAPTLENSPNKYHEQLPVILPGGIESSTSGSSNEGDFEYGSGRVAALAKHFSQMGEAGIIRGKGGKFIRDRYKSEPSINVSDGEMSPKPGDIILPPEAFMTDYSDCELVLNSNGLRPVGFSMDRLIDIGHEIVVKEVKPEMAQITRIDADNTVNSTNIIIPPNSEPPPEDPVVVEDSPLINSHGSPKLTSPVKLTPKRSPVLFRRRAPLLDPNRKSISVDEVEMRKRSKSSGIHKHYSLVELINVDQLNTSGVNADEDALASRQPPASSNFCTSESIHRMYNGSGQRDMRRWMSVDDSSKSLGWPEKLKEKDKLDFGGSKDVLHKKCKLDAIKGRKNRRLKKLELQRSFVVTPVKLGHLGRSDDPNTLWFRSLDPGPGDTGLDVSRKL